MADPIPAPIASLPPLKLSRERGPLYQQLAELLRSLISRGVLEVGSDLPKEAEIGSHFGVSLITVRRALREIEDLGMLQKRSAKLARITSRSPTARTGMKFGSLEDMSDFTSGSELVIADYAPHRGRMMEKHFGLAAGEAGWRLRGHLAQDGQPRTLFATWFPPEIGGRMRLEDFTDVLIFRNVTRCLGIRIERVLISARAEIAGKAQAQTLQVPTGSPMLTTEMVYLDRNRKVVEVTVTNTPAEHFVLSYEVALDAG